jgi:two-component sensor histidine kinase
MSRAVSTPGPLSSILAMIAARAVELVGGRAADILLLDRHSRLRFAGQYGLSDEYRAIFNGSQEGLPGTEAVHSGHPVVIADTEADPRFQPWLEVARRWGYRSVAAAPLTLGGNPIGVLTVYRSEPGSWSTNTLRFLDLIGAHAASAVRTAQFIDDQKHRLTAYSRAVRALREQTDNHVAQYRSLLETLESDNPRSIACVVSDFASEHHELYAAVAARIKSPVVASVLLGEASIASSQNIEFRLDRRSRLERLPARLGEIETVSVISNLLDNASCAVARAPTKRRRVSLLIRQDSSRTVFRVRDWGVGLGDIPAAQLLEHGFTTKDGHAGAGLGLVTQLAEAAGGRVTVERPTVGAIFTVEVPND